MRFATFIIFLMLSTQAFAQNARYASEQRANAATTYYARARTMLVEALAEYEQGRRYAQPNMIHDPEEFRLALVSLTEELNRLVDPHVKITRDGVRVKANPRMIRRERERLPEVVDGAQDASDYGEKRRMKEIKEARARMYAPKEEEKVIEEVKEEPKEEQKEELTDAEKKESVDEIIEQAVEDKATEEKSEEISSDSDAEVPVETAKEEVKVEQDSTSGKVAEEVEQEDAEASKDEASQQPEEKAVSKEESPKEDEAVASAIESTIQERLKNLEVGLDEESAE